MERQSFVWELAAKTNEFQLFPNFSSHEAKIKISLQRMRRPLYDESIYTKIKKIDRGIAKKTVPQNGSWDDTFVWEMVLFGHVCRLCDFFSEKQYQISKNCPAWFKIESMGAQKKIVCASTLYLDLEQRALRCAFSRLFDPIWTRTAPQGAGGTQVLWNFFLP